MRPIRRALVAAIAPAIRLLPSWWRIRLYLHLTGDPFEQGGYSGIETVRRVEPHGYAMRLALDDWMERFAYYVGCYYEIDATASILRFLRPGDLFIDVGANLGFITLTASRVVGPEGKVLAFEPNAVLAKRLKESLRSNSIENVTVHANALGERDEEAVLDATAHFGAGNLRNNGAVGAPVRVLRGDHFVSEINPDAWVFAKLDVEGYELRVLKGFSSLLRRPRTGFLVEVTDQWLQDLGESADQLFDIMRESGFQAFRPEMTFLTTFKLHRIDGAISGTHQYDVLFFRPGDGWLSR